MGAGSTIPGPKHNCKVFEEPCMPQSSVERAKTPPCRGLVPKKVVDMDVDHQSVSEFCCLDEVAVSQSPFVPAADYYWRELQGAELLAQGPRVSCRCHQCHHWLHSTPIFCRGQGWPGQPVPLVFPSQITFPGIFPSHCGTGLSVTTLCHCALEWRVPFTSLLNTTFLHITH